MRRLGNRLKKLITPVPKSVQTTDSSCFTFIRVVNKRDVLVQFRENNQLYIFYDAAKHYKKWVNAKSKGQFFHNYINYRFKYSRVINDIY